MTATNEIQQYSIYVDEEIVFHSLEDLMRNNKNVSTITFENVTEDHVIPVCLSYYKNLTYICFKDQATYGTVMRNPHILAYKPQNVPSLRFRLIEIDISCDNMACGWLEVPSRISESHFLSLVKNIKPKTVCFSTMCKDEYPFCSFVDLTYINGEAFVKWERFCNELYEPHKICAQEYQG